MPRRRMIWNLYLPFLTVTLITVLVVAWYADRSQRTYYMKQTQQVLEDQSLLFAAHIRPLLLSDNIPGINGICTTVGTGIAGRLTVILADGTVVGDSEADPAVMEDHAARAEIAAALDGHIGTSVRFSNTLQQRLFYLARPISDSGHVIAVVRVALSMASIDQALGLLRNQVLLGGLVVLLVAALISGMLSKWISRPLEEMKRGADRIAAGDLESRLPVPEIEEVAAVSRAMNIMAERLNRRILRITRQRNEQEAILSSMVEGVIAIDTDERIIKINRAAAKLFNTTPDRARDRTVPEVLRHAPLQQLVGRILAGEETAEAEITVIDNEPRYLKVSGGSLRDSGNNRIGAIILLNDITRLRQLEDHRRDFVANVSHELRTPITSIKGFVETLLNGPDTDSEDRERFLKIVARHADRLNAIIEDLLSLAKIEQGQEILFEKKDIRRIIESAVQSCEPSIERKRIRVAITCESNLVHKINQPLLEQALVNLINNAVKYSDEEKDISITAERADGEVTITVRDNGCGIAAEHLPRIFERFYRIDKARSRQQGGTGLGLAIVKHIARAHHGRVTVDSQPGRGAAFAICLPEDK